MTRLGVVMAASDDLLNMRIEDPEWRSHTRVIEAIAIPSRDVKKLVEATGGGLGLSFRTFAAS